MQSWAKLKNLKMLVKKESSQKQAAPKMQKSLEDELLSLKNEGVQNSHKKLNQSDFFLYIC